MAQVLLCGVDIAPEADKWKCARCDSVTRILDYFTGNNIVAVSGKVFLKHKRFFLLLKLANPHSVIGVCGNIKRPDAKTGIVKVRNSDISNFIEQNISAKITVINYRERLEAVLAELDKEE